MYHIDKECNQIIIQLLDALCQWERDTSRETTLILIPHNKDENILVAQNGKPFSGMLCGTPLYLKKILELALNEREPKTKDSFMGKLFTKDDEQDL